MGSGRSRHYHHTTHHYHPAPAPSPPPPPPPPQKTILVSNAYPGEVVFTLGENSKLQGRLSRYESTSVKGVLDSSLVTVSLPSPGSENLATRVAFNADFPIIISRGGNVLSAKSSVPGEQWIDNNGLDHSIKCETCPKLDKKICATCFMSAGLVRLNNTIGTLTNYAPGNETGLGRIICEIEDNAALAKLSGNSIEGIHDKIVSLAERYRQLQAKTVTAVRELVIYAHQVSNGADEYLEFEDESEFLSCIQDLDEVKQAIKEHSEKHSEIKSEATEISDMARGKCEMVEKELEGGGTDNDPSIDIRLQSNAEGTLTRLNTSLAKGDIQQVQKLLGGVQETMKRVGTHVQTLGSTVGEIYEKVGHTAIKQKSFARKLDGGKSTKQLMHTAQQLKAEAEGLAAACDLYKAQVGC